MLIINITCGNLVDISMIIGQVFLFTAGNKVGGPMGLLTKYINIYLIQRVYLNNAT